MMIWNTCTSLINCFLYHLQSIMKISSNMLMCFSVILLTNTRPYPSPSHHTPKHNGNKSGSRWRSKTRVYHFPPKLKIQSNLLDPFTVELLISSKQKYPHKPTVNTQSSPLAEETNTKVIEETCLAPCSATTTHLNLCNSNSKFYVEFTYPWDNHDLSRWDLK